MAKFLVTGACGFIGSHICELLVRSGQDVVAIDDLSASGLESIAHLERYPNIDFRLMDVCSENISWIVKQCDYILHQAGVGSVPRSFQEPARYARTNGEGFANVLSAFVNSTKTRTLVYASSSSVKRLASPYALTKKFNEDLAALYADQLPPQKKIIGLRYHNVFGPRQPLRGEYSAVIPKWIQAIRDDKPVTFNGEIAKRITRDFTYVKDVATANLMAATFPALSGVFDVGSGVSYDLEALYAMLREHLNPAHDKVEIASARPGDIEFSSAYIEDAARVFQWAPKYTLRSGLDDWLGANAKGIG